MARFCRGGGQEAGIGRDEDGARKLSFRRCSCPVRSNCAIDARDCVGLPADASDLVAAARILPGLRCWPANLNCIRNPALDHAIRQSATTPGCARLRSQGGREH
jgi:hypothetical protein